MNCSDIGGGLLLVPQFTPADGWRLFSYFVAQAAN
jgi:hypothetical protein